MSDTVPTHKHDENRSPHAYVYGLPTAQRAWVLPSHTIPCHIEFKLKYRILYTCEKSMRRRFASLDNASAIIVDPGLPSRVCIESSLSKGISLTVLKSEHVEHVNRIGLLALQLMPATG